MSPITYAIAGFSLLAALDRLFGGRLGLGSEFARGFQMLGGMALSMIGIIVISPLLARLLEPCFDWIYRVLKIDPSVIPATLFANDMGGAPLSAEVARDPAIGRFNGLVVSSMMGCTLSFSIPVSMEIVKKQARRSMLLGYLCGIVTIPVGCFFAGLLLRLPLAALAVDLVPLLIFGLIIVAGLLFCPGAAVKAFEVLGWIIKALITAGLILGILRFLLGIELVKGLTPLEDGAAVCVNAAVVMTGAFPMVKLLSVLLNKPLKKLGGLMGIGETAALGLIASLATAMSTYEMMNDMDEKGVMINGAFLVSAGFTFAGHLAFTMAFDAAYVTQVIAGKLISGAAALALCLLLYKKLSGKSKAEVR